MDTNQFEFTIEELLSEFEVKHPTHLNLTQLVEKARKLQLGRKKLKMSLKELQESVDLLRVLIKYQIFDLEATRRENEDLRKLLEEQE